MADKQADCRNPAADSRRSIVQKTIKEQDLGKPSIFRRNPRDKAERGGIDFSSMRGSKDKNKGAVDIISSMRGSRDRNRGTDFSIGGREKKTTMERHGSLSVRRRKEEKDKIIVSRENADNNFKFPDEPVNGAEKKKRITSAEEMTKFENATEAKPVICPLQTNLKWKKLRVNPEKELLGSLEKHDNLDFLTLNPDYITFVKVLHDIKETDMLETMLSPEENKMITVFLENGLVESVEPKEQEVVKLFSKGIFNLYGQLTSPECKIKLDETAVEILKDDQQSQLVLLDLILMVPEFMPEAWGGKAMGMRTSVNGAQASAKVCEILDPKESKQPRNKIEDCASSRRRTQKDKNKPGSQRGSKAPTPERSRRKNKSKAKRKMSKRT